MRTKFDEMTKTAGDGKAPATVAVVDSPSDPAAPRSLHSYRAEAEAHAISRALEMVGWNRRRAAELLRISYRGLLYKIRQYKITAADRQVNAQGGGEQVDET